MLKAISKSTRPSLSDIVTIKVQSAKRFAMPQTARKATSPIVTNLVVFEPQLLKAFAILETDCKSTSAFITKLCTVEAQFSKALAARKPLGKVASPNAINASIKNHECGKQAWVGPFPLKKIQCCLPILCSYKPFR